MEPEEPKDSDSQEPQKSPKSYSKRPMWQWLLIYLVVAAVVYGLIYYVFIRKSSGY